jgi:hypothetical protein
MEFLNKIAQFFSSLNFGSITLTGSDVLTIIFGITGGLLTIVGLISIFVSLNTQHSVEKIKDLLIEMKGSSYAEADMSNFYKDYLSYKEILKEGIPEKVTKRIIRLAIFSLAIVLIFWILTSLFYMNIFIFFLTTFSGIIIVIFIKHLWKLHNTSKSLNFPDPQLFLNLHDDTINTFEVVKELLQVRFSIRPKEGTLPSQFNVKELFHMGIELFSVLKFENLGIIRIQSLVKVNNDKYLSLYADTSISPNFQKDGLVKNGFGQFGELDVVLDDYNSWKEKVSAVENGSVEIHYVLTFEHKLEPIIYSTKLIIKNGTIDKPTSQSIPLKKDLEKTYYDVFKLDTTPATEPLF